MARVLVVDDEEILCELYRQELEDEGYRVACAFNGDDALDVVKQEPIDVVVLDIAMPGMDGVEALGRILDLNNQLPVILNTAYASYKQDFMTWAAEDYVIKSADLSELLQSIERALKKRNAA